jgi:hypothetical protein
MARAFQAISWPNADVMVRRFADRSGSKNPINVFRGAAGGVVLARLMCLDEAQINPIDHRV